MSGDSRATPVGTSGRPLTIRPPYRVGVHKTLNISADSSTIRTLRADSGKFTKDAFFDQFRWFFASLCGEFSASLTTMASAAATDDDNDSDGD